jgi:hypothetical protein
MRVAGPLIGAAIAFAVIASGASAGQDRRAADFDVASSAGGFDWVSAALGASAGTGLLIGLMAIADMGRRSRRGRIIRRRHPTLRAERQRNERKERRDWT